MAAEVVWLDDAKDDVRLILEYLAVENATAAAGYVAALTKSCEKLAEFPLAGRRYNAAFRTVVFRNHLIFYRFNKNDRKVTIAAVIDGRRDIEKLIGERD